MQFTYIIHKLQQLYNFQKVQNQRPENWENLSSHVPMSIRLGDVHL